MKLDEGQRLDVFKRWYNFHRGNWADVEQVARRHPKAQEFLDRIEGELRYGRYDRFADPLQKTVEKFIPGHSKYDRNALPGGGVTQGRPVDANAVTKTTARPGRNPQQDTPTLDHPVQGRQRSDQGQSQLTGIMTSFERRLANIERILMKTHRNAG